MSRAGFLSANANVKKMAARFNYRLPSGKFCQTEARRRGSTKKLMEGLQTWKTQQRISSKEKENKNFEATKNIAITTRSSTESALVRPSASVVFIPKLHKQSCQFNILKIRKNGNEKKVYLTPMIDGCVQSPLFSKSKFSYVISVTLKFSMSNVGSAVKGQNLNGLQQDFFRLLTCRFVVITHKGSGATLTSRIKAVLAFAACFLQAPRRRNQGSSVAFPGESDFTSPVVIGNFIVTVAAVNVADKFSSLI